MPVDSVFTFTEDNCSDFLYDLNDSQLWNDILAITSVLSLDGEGNTISTDTLTRGHSPGSQQLYGPRSRRLDRPVLMPGTTASDLVTQQLAYYRLPVAEFHLVQSSMDDVVIQNLLSLNLGDKVTVVSSAMGGTWTCFVQGIDIDGSVSGLLVGTFDLIEARASELES